MTEGGAVPTLAEELKNPRLQICILLGFSSGLPLYVLITMMQAWLASDGIGVRMIGLFALAQIPYSWKFLWAPAMDRFSLPWLGRRRGWILLLHCIVFGLIASIGQFSPSLHIWLAFGLAAALAFFSASLDIVIDAYRRELLPDRELGLGSAIHVNAYKLSSLIPGALALVLSDVLPWSAVYFITALFMVPGAIMLFAAPEPRLTGHAPRTIRAAIVEPFREFIERKGVVAALYLLAFILLYKFGDYLATTLSTAFYLQLGFTRTEIGLIAKGVSLWASVAGGIVGGLWLLRIGINRGLWVFGFLQCTSIFGFVWLAHAGPDKMVLAFAIGIEAFASAGLGTAAFSAFMARSTDPRFAATQFALFTGLASVPRSFAAAGAGYVVTSVGWSSYFLICFLLAMPGMLLLPRIAPWGGENSGGRIKAAQ